MSRQPDTSLKGLGDYLAKLYADQKTYCNDCSDRAENCTVCGDARASVRLAMKVLATGIKALTDDFEDADDWVYAAQAAAKQVLSETEDVRFDPAAQEGLLEAAKRTVEEYDEDHRVGSTRVEILENAIKRVESGS